MANPRVARLPANAGLDLEGSLQAAERLEVILEDLGVGVLGKVFGALLRLRPRVYLAWLQIAVEEQYSRRRSWISLVRWILRWC